MNNLLLTMTHMVICNTRTNETKEAEILVLTSFVFLKKNDVVAM